MHLNSGMIEHIKFINGKDMYMLLMHTMHGAYGSAEFPVAHRTLRKRWKSTRQNPKCCADTSQGRAPSPQLWSLTVTPVQVELNFNAA